MEKIKSLQEQEPKESLMKKICILIDDDEDDLLIFQTVINMHFSNYQLQVFSSFESSKPYLADNSDKITSIFIDLNMPKSNGIDCLKHLRSIPTFKDIPIIIYSTSKNPEDSRKSIKGGATAFISKPSRLGDLVKILSKWLEK